MINGSNFSRVYRECLPTLKEAEEARFSIPPGQENISGISQGKIQAAITALGILQSAFAREYPKALKTSEFTRDKERLEEFVKRVEVLPVLSQNSSSCSKVATGVMICVVALALWHVPDSPGCPFKM